jgi:hypothetical protein
MPPLHASGVPALCDTNTMQHFKHRHALWTNVDDIHRLERHADLQQGSIWATDAGEWQGDPASKPRNSHGNIPPNGTVTHGWWCAHDRHARPAL